MSGACAQIKWCGCTNVRGQVARMHRGGEAIAVWGETTVMCAGKMVRMHTRRQGYTDRLGRIHRSVGVHGVGRTPQCELLEQWFVHAQDAMMVR